MALVNEHFLKLPNNYLFSDIAKKVNAFKVSHPKTDLIRLGIGDVTRPLPQASIEAMHKAVDELANKETFHGYGPEQGYDFLIDAVIRNDYTPRGVYLEPGEVFISDGAKSEYGKYRRHPSPRQQHRRDRPHLPRIHRLERNVRPCRDTGRRAMEQRGILALPERE